MQLLHVVMILYIILPSLRQRQWDSIYRWSVVRKKQVSIMGLTQLTSSSSVASLLRLIVIFALWYKTKAVYKLPRNASAPALFAFGDSIVDSGNNNGIKTLVKCNFPPYGKDFQGGPTGRFCNGKIPSDLLGTLHSSLRFELALLINYRKNLMEDPRN